jgi:hypothetical protein
MTDFGSCADWSTMVCSPLGRAGCGREHAKNPRVRSRTLGHSRDRIEIEVSHPHAASGPSWCGKAPSSSAPNACVRQR